jgi:hypothetical protein
VIGTTCMLLCGSFALHLRAADRGCEVGTRPSLRPLGQEGGEIKQSSGEISRENAKACLRALVGGASPSPATKYDLSSPETSVTGRT